MSGKVLLIKINMPIHLYKEDLPIDIKITNTVAIDTETMGLNLQRDRLCLVQLNFGDKNCHIVQLSQTTPAFKNSPNLVNLLTNKSIKKIFHYARFDLSILMKSFDIVIENIFCTKIASRLVRTYTDKHSLFDLCKEFLSIELNKANRSSDWGNPNLTKHQLEYAASDVLYLHKLKEKLEENLGRENRLAIAQACFDFLPYRAMLDILAMEDVDIFAHH